MCLKKDDKGETKLESDSSGSDKESNEDDTDQTSDSEDENDTYTHDEVRALLRFYVQQIYNEAQVEEN